MQEVARYLSRGVQLLTASGDDPTRKMMRQIAGAFAEYEKALWSPSRVTRESASAKNWGSVKVASRTWDNFCPGWRAWS
jgi:hypothetical protein